MFLPNQKPVVIAILSGLALTLAGCGGVHQALPR